MSGLAGELTLRSAVPLQPPFGLLWTPTEAAAAAGNGFTAEIICEWASAASSWLQK